MKNSVVQYIYFPCFSSSINEQMGALNNNMAIIHSKKEKKKRFEKRFSSLLLDSYQNPSSIGINGAFFLDNENFAANPKILSNKLSIKPNSLVKDFRFFEIKCVKKIDVFWVTVLPDIKGWKVYQHLKKEFTLNKILLNTNCQDNIKSLDWNDKKKRLSKSNIEPDQNQICIHSSQSQPSNESDFNEIDNTGQKQQHLKSSKTSMDFESILKVPKGFFEEDDENFDSKDFNDFYF